MSRCAVCDWREGEIAELERRIAMLRRLTDECVALSTKVRTVGDASDVDDRDKQVSR